MSFTTKTRVGTTIQTRHHPIGGSASANSANAQGPLEIASIVIRIAFRRADGIGVFGYIFGYSFVDAVAK
jgi:hypothetical protein